MARSIFSKKEGRARNTHHLKAHGNGQSKLSVDIVGAGMGLGPDPFLVRLSKKIKPAGKGILST